MKKHKILTLTIVVGLLIQLLFVPTSLGTTQTTIDSFDVNTINLNLWTKIKGSGVTDKSSWEKGFYTLKMYTDVDGARKLSIYRFIKTEEKIKIEIRTKINLTYSSIGYSHNEIYFANGRLLLRVYSETLARILYWDTSGNLQLVDVDITENVFYRYKIEIDRAKSICKIAINYDNGTKLFEAQITDGDFFYEDDWYVKFEIRADVDSGWVENSWIIDYVEAPFKKPDWSTSGFEATDSPLDMFVDYDQSEYAELKVENFQGFKALWNFSISEAQAMTLEVRVLWYNPNGTKKCAVKFWVTHDGTWFYLRASKIDEGDTFWDWELMFDEKVGDATAKNQGTIAEICVWRERGYWFFGVAKEHNVNPLRIFRVDSSVGNDFVTIRHYVSTGSYSGQTIHSVLDEFELFAGRNEDISRPRFGGAWWEWKPLQKIWKMLLSGFKWIAEHLTDVLKPLLDTMKSVMDNMKGVLDNIKSGIDNLATWIWDKFSTYITNINDYVTSMAEDVYNWFLDKLNEIRDYIYDIASNIWQWVIDSFNTLYPPILDFIMDMINYVGNILGIENLAQKIIDLFNAVEKSLTWFIENFDDVLNDLEGLFTLIFDVFVTIINIAVDLGVALFSLHLLFSTWKSLEEGDFQPLMDTFILYIQIFIAIITILLKIGHIVVSVIGHLIDLV